MKCGLGFSVLSLLVVVLTVGGCATGQPDLANIQVSATTTQVADLVRNVAGERAEVDGILPPNADPHEYEPRPSDAAGIAAAAVVFKSGGDLDVWADQLVAAAGGGGEVVALIDSAETISGDPHWWHDPRNAISAVSAIRGALSAADPGGSDQYESNAATYTAELERLDQTIATCIDRLPSARRKLVTEHDALGYFADRYGLDVIGAATPALTTQAQPSAGETAALVDQIRAEGVLAVFPESGLNPELARAIASEGGARIGGALYADTLGPAASEGATYAGAMLANAQAIVAGLSGGELSCPT